jgi:hypothetical protein
MHERKVCEHLTRSHCCKRADLDFLARINSRHRYYVRQGQQVSAKMAADSTGTLAACASRRLYSSSACVAREQHKTEPNYK